MGKQKKRRIRKWMICLVCDVFLSACTYHTPDQDWEKNGRVRLLLDWQIRVRPSVMTYHFYKDGTGSPVVRRGDTWGYEGTLPAGHYKVVVCNTDCENVLLETENGYEEACGRARQVSSLKSSQVLIEQPGNLYGTGCEEIDVGGENFVVRELSPVSLVRRLELNIKVTSGETSGVVQCEKLTGRLSGLSPGVYLSNGKPFTGTPAFVVFEPERTPSGIYTTTQNLFNLSEKETGGSPVSLLLDMELSDGKEVATSVDITEEIGKAFIENTFSVILDLTVRYDEIKGLTVQLAEWKKGNEGSGIVDP
ncbi:MULTISPECIES: DUF5119 domain-containing protein [Parabacteroides]|uniref:DUF5119 domain-containing protein n=1 Tax=Parabacteroides leei TaxID=2939491 RepID=UPI001897B785|nr:DUF5119 domain-containing protein [Parabacteroides goldsteinii]